MSQTKQHLTTALLRLGASKLGKVWDCSPQEVSRRINGDRNISLDDFANALDFLGIKLVDDADVAVIPKDEIRALNLLANRYLDSRLNNGGEG